MSQSRGRPVLRSCWNSITEIDRKGLFGRQASGLLSQEGDRVGQDLVAGIELNAIARVGQDLDHKAFELDEFFLGLSSPSLVAPVLLRLALHGPRGRDNMKRGYRTGWRTWKGPEQGDRPGGHRGRVQKNC